MRFPFLQREQFKLPPAQERENDIGSHTEFNEVTSGENEFEQKMKSYGFEALAGEDDSGYFGEEFAIRTTASRVKTLWGKEPWVYISASLVARSLLTVPMKVRNKQTKKLIENSPIEALLNTASIVQSPLLMRWVSVLDLVLGGNYFLVFNETYTDLMWIPLEMVTLDFHKTEPRIEFISIARMGAGSEGVEKIPMERVVHCMLPNPYNPFFGLSAYLAGSRPILKDRYQEEFEMAFYLRGATNSGVIETTQDLGRSRMKRLMRSFEAGFTGRRNWWRTLFLPKGAKWQNASLSMKDMTHLELKKDNRNVILALLSIPPSRVGLTEDVNRATSTTQDRHFWEDTIVPYALFTADSWNHSYFMQVKNPTVEIYPDFSGIEQLKGYIVAKGEQSRAMETTHWIDEIREKIWGDEPLPNGAGEKFAAEVRGSAAGGILGLAAKGINTEFVNASNLHRIEFDLQQFDAASARKWMDANDFRNFLRESTSSTHVVFLMKEGDLFVDGSWDSHKIEDGIYAITGRLASKEIDDPEPDPNQTRRVALARVKARVMESQERIERQISNLLVPIIDKHIGRIITIAVRALQGVRDVKSSLENMADERFKLYWSEAESVLDKAMERGFTFMLGQTEAKSLYVARTKLEGDVDAKFSGFSDLDLQAIDALRERGRDGKRTVLEKIASRRFKEFDDTQTERILQFIEEGFTQGLNHDQVARQIRSEFEESYRNQARTIVRTESLSAVSQGIDWNREVLSDVFPDLEKQWIGSGKPTSRPEHNALEDQGPIPHDQAWNSELGGSLQFPRDPTAGAQDVVNCGCSMSHVIPDGAKSNAAAILETES